MKLSDPKIVVPTITAGVLVLLWWLLGGKSRSQYLVPNTGGSGVAPSGGTATTPIDAPTPDTQQAALNGTQGYGSSYFPAAVVPPDWDRTPPALNDDKRGVGNGYGPYTYNLPIGSKLASAEASAEMQAGKDAGKKDGDCGCCSPCGGSKRKNSCASQTGRNLVDRLNNQFPGWQDLQQSNIDQVLSDTYRRDVSGGPVPTSDMVRYYRGDLGRLLGNIVGSADQFIPGLVSGATDASKVFGNQLTQIDFIMSHLTDDPSYFWRNF